MLSAPVSRQTTGSEIMEKFRQKIRKYTLQPDLLHFRVSVKGWHLQHYYAEVFLQNGFREGWQRFTLLFAIQNGHPSDTVMSSQFNFAWLEIFLSLTIIFQLQSTLHEQIPMTSLESYWYDCLLWISLEVCIFTRVCLYRTVGLGGFGIFYLYIINTRVIIFFFHVHAMSCLSS